MDDYEALKERLRLKRAKYKLQEGPSEDAGPVGGPIRNASDANEAHDRLEVVCGTEHPLNPIDDNHNPPEPEERQTPSFADVPEHPLHPIDDNHHPPEPEERQPIRTPSFADVPEHKVVFQRWVVDSFGRRNVSGFSGFFLTHFHSDHYGGLTSSWDKGIIHCSDVTARLVISQLGVDPKWCKTIPLNQRTSLDEEVGGQSSFVTFFEANHCPGAVMLLFECAGEFVLHVGDFRYTPSMREFPGLKEIKPRDISKLYLDTTFNDPKMNFPPQEVIVEAVVDRVAHHLRESVNPLIIFGAYTIGKERVFLEVQRRLGGLIYASPKKLRLFSLLGLDMTVFTAQAHEARYRVCGMGDVSFRKVEALASMPEMRAAHDSFVGIAPSGWEWQRVSKKWSHLRPYTYRTFGTVHCYGFPYSEHSSYSELLEFVAWIQPKTIVPTVFNGGTSKVAIEAQLIPYHKYMDMSKSKSTLFGYFAAGK